MVVDVNNLDTAIKEEILIDIIADIQCGTKSEGCKSTKLPFLFWSSEFEKFIKKESGVLYYKSIDYMTSTETVLKVKMDSFSSNIDNITCIDESNGSETTCPVLTSMKFLLKKQTSEPESDKNEKLFIPLLKHSFKHKLSATGLKTFLVVK